MKNIISKQHLESIHKCLKEWDIIEYKINQDGSVDVMQNVDIYREDLDELRFKFNNIHGDFSFTDSNLVNLNNMPEYVDGHFDVSANNLTSLKGCPRVINGDFTFSHNQVESTYVGNYDVIISGNVYTTSNNFDLSFLDGITEYGEIEYDEDNEDDHDYHSEDGINGKVINTQLLKQIFKFQRHFEIWFGEGLSIKDDNFQELLDELKDGLL